MKLTKSKLKQIIKEIISEGYDTHRRRHAGSTWEPAGMEPDPDKPGDLRTSYRMTKDHPKHPDYVGRTPDRVQKLRTCEEYAAQHFPDRAGDASYGGVQSEWPPGKVAYYERCQEFWDSAPGFGKRDLRYKLTSWAEKARPRGFVDIEEPKWRRKELGMPYQEGINKMKITKSKLKQIIKEEVKNALKENVPNPEFRAKVEKGESEKRAKAEKAAEEQALHDAASFKAIESTVPPGQFLEGRDRFDFQRAGSTQKEDLVFALYYERHDFSGTPLDEVANWWLTNFPKQDSPLPVGYIAGAFKAQGDLDTMLSEPLNAADQRIKDKMESWR